MRLMAMRVGRSSTIWAVVAACACALAGQAAPAAPAPALTLAQALARARVNSPQFLAAVAAVGVAQGARTQARAALLPSLAFNENYIFTQDNIYVANDGPHEFMSLGDVHESLDFGSRARLKWARAGEALARAQQEIAARGLAAVVTADYYTLVASQRKQATAGRAVADAEKYLSISRDREKGGEVAHADVIQAQLQLEQRQRDLAEAQLAQEQARLALAVLLFPDFNQNYTLQDDLGQVPPLPGLAQVQAMAAQHNPQLAAAEAAMEQARQEVGIARANLLPKASLDYFYGMDAHEFALRNQYGHTNLGNSVMGMLSVPLFDWGSNRSKLKQSQLLRQQAQVELSYAQRALVAQLQGAYAEAQAARGELATLASSRVLAAESLRLVGLRYQSGAATILELVDAQNSNTLARNAYNDGQVRYRVALANLQTLTGAF